MISKMWSDLFQNHSKCFVNTSLHIIKCLKCKMFHNFLGMFHLPDIFQKIQGFKMWSDWFQNHSKCFVDTSLHIIKYLKCKMFHNFLRMFHLPDIFRKIYDFKNVIRFVPKPLKMLCRHFHTHNQVFKVQNVP
jgi:hypothetical protein